MTRMDKQSYSVIIFSTHTQYPWKSALCKNKGCRHTQLFILVGKWAKNHQNLAIFCNKWQKQAFIHVLLFDTTRLFDRWETWSYHLHLYFLHLFFLNMCLFKLLLSEKLFVQILQSNIFILSWTFWICLFNLHLSR